MPSLLFHAHAGLNPRLKVQKNTFSPPRLKCITTIFLTSAQLTTNVNERTQQQFSVNNRCSFRSHAVLLPRDWLSRPGSFRSEARRDSKLTKLDQSYSKQMHAARLSM